MNTQNSALKGIRYKEDIQKYEARIYINHSSYSKTFDALDDAIAWRKSMEGQKSSDHFLTIVQIIPDWLKSLKNDTAYSPQTYLRYSGDAKAHLLPFFGSSKIKEVGEDLVLKFAVQLKQTQYKGKMLAPKTIKNVIGTLSNFFEYCWSRGYIALNPASTSLLRQNLKRLLKDRRNATRHIREKSRTSEEIQALLLATYQKGYEFGLITELMFATASRLGEISALLWNDIKCTAHPSTGEEVHYISITKTRDHRTNQIQLQAKCGSNGTVPISSILYGKLIEWKNHSESMGYETDKEHVVFPYLTINPMKFSEGLATLSEKIGITRTTAHCLRHSSLTFLGINAHNLQEVQKFGRHSSIKMTQNYFAASHLQINNLSHTFDRFSSQSIPNRNLG